MRIIISQLQQIEHMNTIGYQIDAHADLIILEYDCVQIKIVSY